MRTIISTAVALITVLLISISASAASPTYPWQSAYSLLLDQYRSSEEGMESYTLYDIDKDGTPELLICMDMSTAGGNHLVYTYDGDVKYVDKVYTGSSSLYTWPSGNGFIVHYGHMNHAVCHLYSLESGALTEQVIFEESIDQSSWYTPVEDIAPGAEYIPACCWWSDYGLLAYDVWSSPVIPVSSSAYPNNDENYFPSLITGNDPIIRVKATAGYFVQGDNVQVIGFADLIEQLGVPVTSGAVQDLRAYMVDMDQDGQLECVLCYRQREGKYTLNAFTLILTEQNGLNYGYLLEHNAPEDVTGLGVMYYYNDEYGFVSEYAQRIYFDGEDYLIKQVSLDEVRR